LMTERRREEQEQEQKKDLVKGELDEQKLD
jgi:hypothetical protein